MLRLVALLAVLLPSAPRRVAPTRHENAVMSLEIPAAWHEQGPAGTRLNLDPDEGDVFTDGEFYFSVAEEEAPRAPVDATWELRLSPDRRGLEVVRAPPPCAGDHSGERVDDSCYPGKKSLELGAEIDTPRHRHLVFSFGHHGRAKVDETVFRRIFASVRFK